MNITTHILQASGRLKPFINEIKKIMNTTIPLIEERIPVKNVDIIIYDNPEGAIPEFGIGGYTPNANLVYISIDPSFPNLQTSINMQLKRTVAHELHHALRWNDPGYGETLLDSLVTEGLADHFDLELFHKKPQPWSVALSENEIENMMSKAEKEFNNKNYDHSSWFFGNKEQGIPHWAGYSLGFNIISNYLQKYPKQKPSLLFTTKTSDFLNLPFV